MDCMVASYDTPQNRLGGDNHILKYTHGVSKYVIYISRSYIKVGFIYLVIENLQNFAHIMEGQ